MKIVRENNDLGLSLGHALDLIAPLARDLDGGLHRLRAGVHGQDFGRLSQRAQLLAERSKLIVTEGARCERQPGRLRHHRIPDLGMTMALVDGGVAGEAIEIAVTLDIPHIHAFAAAQHHVQRLVIRCAVILFRRDVIKRRRIGTGSGGGSDIESHACKILLNVSVSGFKIEPERHAVGAAA